MIVTDKNINELVELFSKEQIQSRIKQLAQEINKDFASTDELVIIGVLKGSVLFVSDLIRQLSIPVQVEFVRLASYGDEQHSCGKVQPVDLTLPNLSGKDVLIVEDIVDTGLTAQFFIDYVKTQHNPEIVKFASLLDKSCARIHPVKIDYTGFSVDDKFVVGYGLDYMGFFRNLPYIGHFPS